MGWNPSAVNGQLSADSFDFQLPMLKVTNLHVLKRDEGYIGDDTRVSGGKLGNPQRGDGFRETLNLIIWGDVDPDGDAVANPLEGWLSNVNWIRTNLTNRTGVGNGTKLLELVWGGETTVMYGRVGPLVLGEANVAGAGTSLGTCEIWCPFGPFVTP